MYPIAFIQNLSSWEIILIFLVVLLFFGAKRLPDLFRSFGKSLREFKKATSDIESDIRTAMEEDEEEPKKSTKTSEKTEPITEPITEPKAVETKSADEISETDEAEKVKEPATKS